MRPPIDDVTDPNEFSRMLIDASNSCSYFAENFLGLDVFDYNKVFLDCKDRFLIARTGRQCLEKDEYVYCNDGIKRADEIRENDEIYGGMVEDIEKF